DSVDHLHVDFPRNATLPLPAEDGLARGPVRLPVLRPPVGRLPGALRDPAVSLVAFPGPVDALGTAGRLAGGKARLGLAKGPLDAPRPLRWIALPGQGAVPASFEDRGAHVAVRDPRIAAYHGPLDRHDPPQLPRGLVFVGLGGHAAWADHGVDLRGRR